MRCPTCGETVDEGVATCPHCDARIDQPAEAPLPVIAAASVRGERRRHRGHGGIAVTVGATLALAAAVGSGIALIGPSFLDRGPVYSSPSIRKEASDEEVASTSTQDAPASDDATSAQTLPEEGTSPSGTYILPDSDSRSYSAEELDTLSDEDLVLARNEIFARHGRRFSDAGIQAYFDGQDWYEGRYSPEEFDSMTGMLNRYESANVTTIQQVEATR